MLGENWKIYLIFDMLVKFSMFKKYKYVLEYMLGIFYMLRKYLKINVKNNMLVKLIIPKFVYFS